MPVKKDVKEKVERTPGGRPRTVSLPPGDMIKLGIEMCEWVDINKPTHLSEWFSIEKYYTWAQWRVMTEAPEFSPYYERALNMVARNARDGTLDKSIAQRFLALYHRDLRSYDHEELEKKAELLKQETQAVTDAEVARFTLMMDLISKKQKT